MPRVCRLAQEDRAVFAIQAIPVIGTHEAAQVPNMIGMIKKNRVVVEQTASEMHWERVRYVGDKAPTRVLLG